jgi:hypothetical protein
LRIFLYLSMGLENSWYVFTLFVIVIPALAGNHL